MTLFKQNEPTLSFKNDKTPRKKTSLWYTCYFTHLRANLNLFLTHCQFPCQMSLVINILTYLKNFAIQLLPHSSQQYFMWLITGINDHFLKEDLAISCDFWYIWLLTNQPPCNMAEFRLSGRCMFIIKFHRIIEYQFRSDLNDHPVQPFLV